MVALRRLFHAEKVPSTPVTGDREFSAPNPSPGRNNPTPLAGNSLSLNENEHFQHIEREFEVLHDQLKAHPIPPPLHIPLSRASSRLTSRKPRHIDLLDALFSSHRYQMQPSRPISPITPYNEDVAERNMAPFLRGRNPRSRNSYNRILSALYQEDVADRNIAENRRRSRSVSRSTSRSRLTTSYSYQLDYQRQGDGPRTRSRSREKESQLVNSISQEALFSVPKSYRDRVVSGSSDSPSSAGGFLRTQRSAPTVLSEQTPTPRGGDSSRTGTHLGVPPAYKQGDTWSNTPLPDSPTLPTITYVQATSSQTQRQQESPETSTPSPRLQSETRDKELPISPRVGSKKNVRDLSINTELAARGRPRNISHRAIQPPTPNNYDMAQNPSIAEIINSPPQVATPSELSPLPSSNQKVAEIMDMFRKAYASTRAITPHPTFETLQDAIIREINSHEAFQRVPVPEPGPPFTPSSAQSSFNKCDNTPRPSGPIPLKDGQLSKLIRKSSFKKHVRDSEARKSISTSVPSIVSRRATSAPSRRRHTDAPPPSHSFFDAVEPRELKFSEQPVTYMDLLRSEKSADPKRNRTTSMSGGNGPNSTPTPSVLYMRAQTSPSDDSRTSFSVDDSDSDIIHLPSVSGIPQVQIQGVDENNVTYVVENTTPQTAHRLMNWPRKSNRSLSLRSTFAQNGHHTPSGRSVESY